MKLLALDAATEACSVALLQGEELCERYELIGRGHAERLLPMVDELLVAAGLRLAGLDAIAFGRGPGGFTGLRIAAGITQGLAAGAGLPVLPVSNLAALAAAGASESGVRRVLACLDARMGEVYWAAFDCGDAQPLALTPEVVTKPEAVRLPDGEPCFGVGPGLAAWPLLVERLGPGLCGCNPALLPRAAWIARLGALDLAAGRAVDAAFALPRYLRDDVIISQQ